MIFAGHIKDAANLIVGMLEDVGDVETAQRWDLAQINRAAHVLRAGCDEAIGQLDLQIGSQHGGGLGTVVSGAPAQQSAVTLAAQVANLQQQDQLVNLRGYTGRVIINVEQAAG